jgi:uncharacterized membrane protein
MMKTLVPVIILVLLYLLFLVCVILSTPLLPEQAATSFDLHGLPDQWMSRHSYLFAFAGIGSVALLVMIAIGFLSHILPKWIISIPNRDYWLAPKHRAGTTRYLVRMMLWFDCLFVVFITGVHFSIIQANKQDPVQLPKATFLGLLGFFIIGVGYWSWTINRHFRRIG